MPKGSALAGAEKGNLAADERGLTLISKLNRGPRASCVFLHPARNWVEGGIMTVPGSPTPYCSRAVPHDTLRPASPFVCSNRSPDPPSVVTNANVEAGRVIVPLPSGLRE
jgi:hypothetical protein